jgi:hypothetical protein
MIVLQGILHEFNQYKLGFLFKNCNLVETLGLTLIHYPFPIIPHLSTVEDAGNIRVCILRGNKPISGSFSPPDFPTYTGKLRITDFFCSCGE